MDSKCNFVTRTLPKRFKIYRNHFLAKNIDAYYNCPYKGYQKEGNPDFLNKLKNSFCETGSYKIELYKQKAEEILLNDLEGIMQAHNLENCVCVCVPRAKALTAYKERQLKFMEAVNNAANRIANMESGIDVIVRHTNTRTTHLSRSQLENDGKMPYPKITEETCFIKKEKIEGKSVILVDDIYTKNVNIDEDCIQAVLNNGAKEVIFYAIARTGG